MTKEILIRELRRIAIENEHRCFGCGFEHGCSVHGCAIIREALEQIIAPAKPEPNEPLTLDELREMDGEPVWLERAWAWRFVLVEDNIPILAGVYGDRCKAKSWLALCGNIYRRKLEEAENG